jgi:hypothetical protein
VIRDAHGKHVTRGTVDDGVLDRRNRKGEAVALVTAEYQEIRPLMDSGADDLAFYRSQHDLRPFLGHFELACERADPLPGDPHELGLTGD